MHHSQLKNLIGLSFLFAGIALSGCENQISIKGNARAALEDLQSPNTPSSQDAQAKSEQFSNTDGKEDGTPDFPQEFGIEKENCTWDSTLEKQGLLLTGSIKQDTSIQDDLLGTCKIQKDTQIFVVGTWTCKLETTEKEIVRVNGNLPQEMLETCENEGRPIVEGFLDGEMVVFQRPDYAPEKGNNDGAVSNSSSQDVNSLIDAGANKEAIKSAIDAIKAGMKIPGLNDGGIARIPGLNDGGISGIPGLSDGGVAGIPGLGDGGVAGIPGLGDGGVAGIPGLGEAGIGNIPNQPAVDANQPGCVKVSYNADSKSLLSKIFKTPNNIFGLVPMASIRGQDFRAGAEGLGDANLEVLGKTGQVWQVDVARRSDAFLSRIKSLRGLEDDMNDANDEVLWTYQIPAMAEATSHTIALADIIPPNDLRSEEIVFKIASDIALENIPECEFAMRLMSPIVLHFAQSGFPKLSPLASKNIRFDLNNDGTTELVSWVSGESAILTLDLNKNGKIDNGGELFGDYTKIGNKGYARNGYQALSMYDQNQDQYITEADPIFHQLQLWFDKNQNGQSDVGELVALKDRHITKIATHFKRTNLGNTELTQGSLPYSSRFFGPKECGLLGCKSFDIYFRTLQTTIVNSTLVDH